MSAPCPACGLYPDHAAWCPAPAPRVSWTSTDPLRTEARPTFQAEPVQAEPAETAVAEAMRIVRGNREAMYGKPSKNFETIAAMWQAYLSARSNPGALTPLDVAYMMVLMKTARLANKPDHRDSIVDIVGYADCADAILREAP